MASSVASKKTSSDAKMPAKLYQDAQEALAWFDETEQSCDAGECGLSLRWLISAGSKHLIALEKCQSVIDASDDPDHVLTFPVVLMRECIGRWRAAAADAETIGLSRDVTYIFWHQNIKLSETVTKAIKWFDTAEKVANSNAMDAPRLRKLIKDANHRVASLECRAHPTRARLMLVGQFLDKSKILVGRWASKIKSMELEKKRNDLIMKKIKKRRCSVCGISAPYSSRALDYCGGCRHPSVARADRPRYCSVECQRLHWLAGHKDECPCVRNE